MTRSTKLPLSSGRAASSGLLTSVRVLFNRFARASDRYRQRRHLEELDDHQLADVGLTRRDVKRECAKPFWEL